MKYVLFMSFCYSASVIAQGQPQTTLPADLLSTLSKEQLIEAIQLLSSMQQQQKVVPPVTPVVVTTPFAMPVPNPGAECAHFVTDMLSQVVTIAIAQDPLVTVNGVTNIVHNLISMIVQQHQNQKRSPVIPDVQDDDDQELSRYELLKQMLTELEELMKELQEIDIAILEIGKE